MSAKKCNKILLQTTNNTMGRILFCVYLAVNSKKPFKTFHLQLKLLPVRSYVLGLKEMTVTVITHAFFLKKKGPISEERY